MTLDDHLDREFEKWIDRERPSGDADQVHDAWLRSAEFHDTVRAYDEQVVLLTALH